MRLNVLTMATHERYQSYMGDIPHNFYLLDNPNKKWQHEFAPLPSNHRIIKDITPDIMPDVVLSQHKYGQFQQLAPIAKGYRAPLISLEHMLPQPWWDQARFEQMKQMSGTVNVYLSNFSADQWSMYGENGTVVIPQAVDSDLFRNCNKKRMNKILSVVNEFRERDAECNYTGWKKIVSNFPHTLIGSSKSGLSKPAKDVLDLVSSYNDHTIFLNTSIVSTMPFTLFEAMACGCCVVSTNTSMIPEVIKHGHNGFLFQPNNIKGTKKLLDQLMNADVDYIKHIGNNARKTILDHFSMSQFTDKWTSVINQSYIKTNGIGEKL